jgi:hypothetical protein
MKECPAPWLGTGCPYSTPLVMRLGLLPGWRFRLGAWAWAQRGGGPSRLDGDGGCLGLGRRQGTKDGLAVEGQKKVGVCLRLVPGGEDKVGLGRPPPHDGQFTGRPICSSPPEISQQVRHHKMPRLPQLPGTEGSGFYREGWK